MITLLADLCLRNAHSKAHQNYNIFHLLNAPNCQAIIETNAKPLSKSIPVSRIMKNIYRSEVQITV